jgi:hypothetical protein
VVVQQVIEAMFGAPTSEAVGYDDAPGDGPTGPEQAVALVQDPVRRRKIIAAVIPLLREDS